ncbi:Flagellar protein FliJ [Methylophaga frappieri]|uniref:Flagellar FliJ protein n=1 Tax=Methylophaga frappieri (strain ATCC BAA-2434 / DSM 25690 / JAM7) TaxID=754477 RepID=I1YKP2_METFJ|nr:flagellar export protein FliJ [Methylophaga frappieri]AFJ03485.1 Flagellar protein FliJ [Methylophaga frappieri]
MTRAQKLLPVIELAKQDAEATQLKLAQANRQLHREQQQLHELQHYREEYLQRFRRVDPQIVSARKALDLRAFLVQLEQAIVLQEQQVQKQHNQVLQQQQAWRQARQKMQAMQTLMERYQQHEVLSASRREQVLNDEFSVSLWRRQRKR